MENDIKKKSTILNDQFKSAFSEPSQLSLEQLSKQAMNDASPQVPQIDPFEITEEGTKNLLSGLNPNKAAGPDKLQRQVLKELADVLAPMVTLIYNALKKIKKCLQTGRLQLYPNFQKRGGEVQGIQLPSCFLHMCPIQMYGKHCGQSCNAASYQN